VMREDHFTNTPEEAAVYESMRGQSDDPGVDRPTRAEADRDEIPSTSSRFPVWWTHCVECDISVTIRHEDHDLEDPDETDEWMECPYCGRSLTGWNGPTMSSLQVTIDRVPEHCRVMFAHTGPITGVYAENTATGVSGPLLDIPESHHITWAELDPDGVVGA
jgi:hypothetical protein